MKIYIKHPGLCNSVALFLHVYLIKLLNCSTGLIGWNLYVLNTKHLWRITLICHWTSNNSNICKRILKFQTYNFKPKYWMYCQLMSSERQAKRWVAKISSFFGAKCERNRCLIVLILKKCKGKFVKYLKFIFLFCSLQNNHSF